MNLITKKREVELRKLKDEHSRESKIKEEKLENLKKQIAGAFKDNSWSRNTFNWLYNKTNSNWKISAEIFMIFLLKISKPNLFQPVI